MTRIRWIVTVGFALLLQGSILETGGLPDNGTKQNSTPRTTTTTEPTPTVDGVTGLSSTPQRKGMLTPGLSALTTTAVDEQSKKPMSNVSALTTRIKDEQVDVSSDVTKIPKETLPDKTDTGLLNTTVQNPVDQNTVFPAVTDGSINNSISTALPAIGIDVTELHHTEIPKSSSTAESVDLGNGSDATVASKNTVTTMTVATKTQTALPAVVSNEQTNLSTNLSTTTAMVEEDKATPTPTGTSHTGPKVVMSTAVEMASKVATSTTVMTGKPLTVTPVKTTTSTTITPKVASETVTKTTVVTQHGKGTHPGTRTRPSTVSTTSSTTSHVPVSLPFQGDPHHWIKVGLGIAVPAILIICVVVTVLVVRRKIKKDKGYITLDDFGQFEGMQNPSYDGEL